MAIGKYYQPSLKSRISLLTLAIFLLGVWSVAVYATQRLQRDMLALLGTQQFSGVATVAGQLDHELQTRLRALDRFAEGVPLALMDKPAELQAYVRTRSDLLELFNGGIRVRDANSHVLALLPDIPEDRTANVADRDYSIAALRDGRTTIGQPTRSRTTGIPIIPLSAPIFDRAGRVVGAVVGIVDLEKTSFFDTVTHHHVGLAGGYLIIAPQYGLIVTGTDKARIMTPMPPPGVNSNHDRFVSGYEGHGIALNSRGVEEIAAARKIPAAGWFLVGTRPTAEVLAPVHVTQQKVLWAALLLSLLVGLLAWLFVRRMLRHQFAPMMAATQALSGMAHPAGAQLQPLPHVQDDEVGQLIGSFNRLIESVLRNEDALKQDIIRREKMEVALRETEARFRKVFEQMPLPTGLLTSDGRIVALNARFVRLFGYTLAEIPDIDAWKGLAYPDSDYRATAEAGWQAATERAMATGSDIELPAYRITCKDGSVRDILISGITLSDFVLTTFLDITDQMQREALLDRQFKYTEMMRQVSVSLINQPMAQLDEALNAALAQVGEFFRADRAYVFDYDLAARTMRNTHEWCAPEIEPQMHLLQCLHFDDILDYVEPNLRGEAQIIPSVQALPPGPLRDILAPQGIQSMMTVPVMAKGVCLGFVGIDIVRQPSRIGDAERELFTVFAELLANLAERKRTEAALRLAANVFTHTKEGITITDLDGNIVDVNAAFTHITGYSREEVLGKNPRILSAGQQNQAFYASMWRTLQADGHWQGEIWNRHKDGNVFAELMTISAVRNAEGDVQNHIALFSDITALKTHQTQLERLAHYDALTDLPNRLLLADRLHQAMNQATRREQHIAVAYLDLDGFKAVNDTHGHQVGDQLLKALAQNMKLVLRDGDTLARLGGDEFVAVLVDLPNTGTSAPVFNRLLEAAAQPIHLGDNVLQVTASLGITFYPQTEENDADQLLRQADQAMYQAKQTGKNRYHVFDTEHDRSVRGHHESLARIKQALADREFLLYYQPKVNMRTGVVIGAEALIRWQHPEKGLLPPAVFLPLIAEHPLAIEIGEWVLDTAMAQIETWKVAGLALPVSVNIDAIHLEQADFVERLRQQLSGHPLVVAGDLELEVLETSALQDIAHVSSVILACHEMGVGFALDDFGTGYSSLSYLKRLPAGLLKIDQGFVHDMLDDPDDLAILDGVLGLASAFRRQAIAEGVETLTHGEVLLQLGCPLAQGYVIARPMPATDIPNWQETWRPDPAWLGCAPIRREDMPILYAWVEHRAWISHMVGYLQGERNGALPLNSRACRFGQWLSHAREQHVDHLAAIEAIEPLHIEIHALAEAMIRFKQLGQTDGLLPQMDKICRLRDRLLAQLLEMLRRNKQPGVDQ